MKLRKLSDFQAYTLLSAYKSTGLQGFDKRCAKTVRAMKTLEKLELLQVRWDVFMFQISANKALVSAYIENIAGEQIEYTYMLLRFTSLKH
jgi:hypothetical protein